MRFSFCKFHCPFICLCKSSQHIYNTGPLRLENAPQVPSAIVSVPDDATNQLPAVVNEVKDESLDDKPEQQPDHCLKSSLRKGKKGSEEAPRKRVQWVDVLGKQLVEIREFESSDANDSDLDGMDNRSCMCVIL